VLALPDVTRHMARLATAALDLLTLSAGPVALAAIAGDLRPASRMLGEQAAEAAARRREMQVGAPHRGSAGGGGGGSQAWA
jgi:hypothetical protein